MISLLLLLLTLRAVDAEQWDDALTKPLALVERYGAKPDHLASLAEIYHRLHRATDETATWEHFMTASPHPNRAVAGLAHVPTHIEGALVAGLAEQRADHRPEARRSLELAASLAPEYFDVRLALGILDDTESRVSQARGHVEAAFLADPARRIEVQPWLDRTAGPK